MPCANLRILAAFAAVASTANAVEPAYGKTIIYDATGGTENGGDGFKAAGHLLLDCILTGPLGEKLTSVVLNLSASKPQDGGEF